MHFYLLALGCRRATEGDIADAFGRYGRLDRVSMKDGFAFLSFVDDRDAEAAVRGESPEPADVICTPTRVAHTLPGALKE